MKKTDTLFDTIGELSLLGISVEEMDRELHKRYGEKCAVLVLDSTGFTRVTKSLGTAFFLSIVQKMRRVCVDIFKENKVIDWRNFADNMFAEFSTVDLALDAALSIHHHFDKNPINLMNEEDLFGACIGIGFGEMLRSENEGVYGNEMNLASKLGEDTAKRGETLLTQAAHDALSHPENFIIEPRRLEISGVDAPIYLVSPIATQ